MRTILSGSSKRNLRKKLLKLLRSQKEEDRLKKSRKIQKKLFRTKEFQKSQVILFYASFDGEVETFRMMKQAKRLGKTIVLPRIIKNRRKLILSLVKDLRKDLIDGPYGIKEPDVHRGKAVEVKTIDLAVIPGIGFDKKNYRLGRGAGYYDRFLKTFPKDIPTIGLAFDFQIIDSLPQQKPHDMPVFKVIVN